MNKNIITHIKDNEIVDTLKTIFKELQLIELKIFEYEEFFHALMHVDPKMFIVEINDVKNPYLKIIKIMKKSVLTRDVPIIVITKSKSKELFDQLCHLDIQAIIYPPLYISIMKLTIESVLKSEKDREMLLSTQDIQTVQTVMISSLATLAEYRDPETGEHIKRTQNYVKALATTLRKDGLFVDELTDENIELIYMSVPLHDIGKVAIKDNILLKPGRLSGSEFETMKTHTTLGYETLINVGSKLKSSAFLEYAADVAYTHHEKYDGTGYPMGLKGDEIPLIGRLMAVADVYDALVSKRVYKESMTHSDAIDIIRSGDGTHFDPRIVACTLKLEATFQNISQTYIDADHLYKSNSQLATLLENNLLKKILVVEDSRIVRTITKNQLVALGFEVDEAEDGVVGLQKVQSNKYDLILLDLEMPRMNGYEMATEVKKMSQHPIMIAITAADFNITLTELKTFGIMGLILKPLDFNRIATNYAEILRAKE
ncbi:MAG: response regulator [Clostridiales bacterium]|nr:response regulator [Clostridiales bacterium]